MADRGGLTASQIAAQAAMQHQAASQHIRKRSQTVPSPQSPPENNGGGGGGGQHKPHPLQLVSNPPRKASSGTMGGQPYHNGSVGGYNVVATSAANAAYPRGAPRSPGSTTFELPAEKEPKLKRERSKMKLFSKPKHIGISSYKDSDKREKLLPSPNKTASPGPSTLFKIVNASTTSLAESAMSSASSIYSSNNASTSTLVPQKGEEKDKAHKPHFLTRQKNKLKEKMDDHSLPLSSASSISRPLDFSAPQSIYNFAPPPSPGPSTTSFTKSMSGLDLRHAGRALREKKREERAAMPLPDSKRSDADWPISSSYGTTGHGFLGSTGSRDVLGSYSDSLMYGSLQGFGVSNMTPDDAWDFLKAKLLIIFEGEELRMPIEDLNRLVTVYIQCCVQKRGPLIITEDLREFLRTGFLSLEQTLRGIPDDRIVPHLVEMWLFVFGKVLPYIQAVFLPLDQEFSGTGTIMTHSEAAEFWGIVPDPLRAFDNELDVRRMVLIAYRDHVILPRHDTLKAIFSRLSLESINVNVPSPDSPGPLGSPRPGTAASLDPDLASFNSQGSTLLDDAVNSRSRTISNTSAPELPSFTTSMANRRHAAAAGTAGFPTANRHPTESTVGSDQVTETVGRMLQCISVLGSVHGGDDAQAKMEGLAKELKLNWLGRGRTGRNRKGFVGTRVRS